MIIVGNITRVSFRKFCKTRNIGGLNKLLADFKLYMEQKDQEALVKTFSYMYKVMIIYTTHGYTRKDSWGQLDTSKHNCYCIMTIASKALLKSNTIEVVHVTTSSTGSKHSCYFLFQVMCCACDSHMFIF